LIDKSNQSSKVICDGIVTASNEVMTVTTTKMALTTKAVA
jgi:hypothetical protein